MRLLIWGRSPLAGWLAAALPAATWLTDESTRAALEKTGKLAADHYVRPVDTLKIATTYSNDYDLILLAAPSWFTAQAIAEIRGVIGWEASPPPIVSLQNGVGAIQRLTSAFGESKVIVGAVTRPFWYPHYTDNQPQRTHILSRNLGGIALQADHALSAEIGSLLRGIGLEVRFGWAESITWSSVFWGLQGNAISSILDIAPSQVYRDAMLFAYEHAQLKEALRVIEKLNIPLIRLPGVNVPLMAWQVKNLPRRVLAPILSMHPRPPSLRDELRLKSGRSDAAYINGAVAVFGHEQKLATPINHALALMLTDLAEGRASWAAFKQKPELLLAGLRLAMG